jgi:hypothetical protein
MTDVERPASAGFALPAVSKVDTLWSFWWTNQPEHSLSVRGGLIHVCISLFFKHQVDYYKLECSVFKNTG